MAEQGQNVPNVANVAPINPPMNPPDPFVPLINFAINNHIADNVARAAFDIAMITDANRATVMTAALHCILNGPVGVQQATSFPGLAGNNISIVQIIGHRISNRQWQNFCLVIAQRMSAAGQLPVDAQTISIFGDYWPISTEKV
jgi:hypothetical protein